MKTTLKRLLAKAVFLSAAFAIQACAPAASSNQVEVARAFESSNVIAVKPYTRTIFSSHDF